MRFVLAGLLFVHGSIHLLGFARGYGLAPVAALKQDISRAAGAVWLMAAVLLVLAAVLVAVNSAAWWGPALVGVLLSQGLVFSAWGDAKFGTVANVLLALPLLIAVLGVLPSSYPHRYAALEREVLQAKAPTPLVTEADLEALPPVVQKYLRRVGVVGQPRVQSFRATWAAKIRSSPTSAWMEAPTVQVNTVEPAARVFLMDATMYGLPVKALHVYRDAQATMEVQLAELFKVADARGETMSKSETVTVLNDLVLLAPSALLGKPFSFSDATDREVTVTYTNGPHTVSARLEFDETGDLVDFISDDRFESADGKTYVNHPWSTPVRGHRVMSGLRLPTGGEALWHEPSGTWAYIEMELLAVEYNVAPTPRAEPTVVATTSGESPFVTPAHR